MGQEISLQNHRLGCAQGPNQDTLARMPPFCCQSFEPLLVDLREENQPWNVDKCGGQELSIPISIVHKLHLSKAPPKGYRTGQSGLV